MSTIQNNKTVERTIISKRINVKRGFNFLEIKAQTEIKIQKKLIINKKCKVLKKE